MRNVVRQDNKIWGILLALGKRTTTDPGGLRYLSSCLFGNREDDLGEFKASSALVLVQCLVGVNWHHHVATRCVLALYTLSTRGKHVFKFVIPWPNEIDLASRSVDDGSAISHGF